MKKVLFTATVDSHILHFHIPFLKLFKDNGYEVHVATNGDEEIPYCDVKHVIPFERSPIKINNLKAIRELKKIVDEEKFDIIHCHTPMGSVVTRLASKNARKNGTRVIYTAHGFHFFKGAPLLNWLIFYPVEWYLSKYTDTLITINKEDFELAKKKFSRRCNDIQYVPGVGIDPKKFDFEFTDEDKKALRTSLGLKEDDFVMIYPARLDKNKNHILIINSMERILKKYKNVHMLFPGNDELDGYYQKVVEDKHLTDNIHFLGYRRDIPRLLRISNIAVTTSIREGFGLNVVEALYNGLPVIATANRGHKDIISNNIDGFLIQFNCEDLCDRIELLYKNNNLMRGAKYVDKFLLNNVVERMKNIYRL